MRQLSFVALLLTLGACNRPGSGDPYISPEDPMSGVVPITLSVAGKMSRKGALEVKDDKGNVELRVSGGDLDCVFTGTRKGGTVTIDALKKPCAFAFGGKPHEATSAHAATVWFHRTGKVNTLIPLVVQSGGETRVMNLELEGTREKGWHSTVK